MAYEAITNTRALDSQGYITRCAQGAAQYPWERSEREQPQAWRSSRVKALMLPCLERDPAARPTAQQLYTSVSRVGQATTAM
jgi:hypothetical protein